MIPTGVMPQAGSSIRGALINSSIKTMTAQRRKQQCKHNDCLLLGATDDVSMRHLLGNRFELSQQPIIHPR